MPDTDDYTAQNRRAWNEIAEHAPRRGASECTPQASSTLAPCPPGAADGARRLGGLWQPEPAGAGPG